MSPRQTAKKVQKPIAPAPSVLDAVNASRGPSTPAPAREEPPVVILHQVPPAAQVEDVVAASAEAPVVDEAPEVEEVQTPVAVPVPEPVVVPVEEPKAKPPTKAAAPAPVAEPRVVESSDAADSVGDLGHYVTRVMADARRAASEFLASVDVDAARRAAMVLAQADAEASSMREAAIADADKIRADARLEGDRLISQRLRIAIDLTDQLYDRASQILADADRPSEARRHLAQLVSALTQSAEDAAAATTLVGKSRS